MKVAIAVIAYASFFLMVEIVARKYKISKEISRKFVHILSGISVAFLPLNLSFYEIRWLSFLFIPAMIFSKKGNVLSSIHHVSRHTYGEVYFPFAILLSAILFPDRSFFMFGILIMSISDALASIIGQKFGKVAKVFLHNKTIVGSMAFLVSAFCIGLFFTPSAMTAGIIAVILTLIEALLGRGLDNLVIPLLASGLLKLSYALPY